MASASWGCHPPRGRPLHRLPQRFTGTLSGARAVAQGTKITHPTVSATAQDHAWRQVFAITKGRDVVAPNRFVAKMTCELDAWVPAAAYSHSVRVQMSIPTGEVDDVNAVNLATASCTSQFSAEQNFRVAEKFGRGTRQILTDVGTNVDKAR